MTRMLIIKTGSAPGEIQRRHGDFHAWFIDRLGPDRFDFQVANVQDGDALPSSDEGTSNERVDAVLVTGSPAMVSHGHGWSEATADWLRAFHATGRPMLGVCYGHQLIAHALGGRVGANPAGRQMGTARVELDAPEDPLLGNFSPVSDFQVTHVESVLEPPSGARVIGRCAADPNHALHFGARSWGVQFHPEFDEEIMACYIRCRSSVLAGEGIDPERLLERMSAAPAGAALLRRFADIAATEAEPA